jgi:FtsP/CotA-like multicopper oxidase with cupredoxin domain
MLPITNGRVPENMRRIRVKQNDVVKLHWTSDVPANLHLHGYDIEKTVSPGSVTDMTFTARAAGRFTVESHVGKTASGGHGHGNVLVTIEVYP